MVSSVFKGHGWHVALLVVLANLQGSGGAIIEGELPNSEYFAEFVGKFCFDSNESKETVIGRLLVEVTRDGPPKIEKPGHLYFMIFDDEDQHWKRAWRDWGHSTCDEKIRAASFVSEVEIYESTRHSTYDVRIREHHRPRFWYFTFVACNAQFNTQIRYQVHATNELRGWQKEFSLDHVGIFSFYATFLALFLLAMVATVWAMRQPEAEEKRLRDHPYMQLLLMSYLSSSASCGLFLMHYVIFMHNGFGSVHVRFMAVLAAVVANCTMFLIAILSSVGWAISSSRLPNPRCFLSLVTFVGGLSVICELHSEVFLDASTKLYSYESPTGVVVLIIKMLMFCWFGFQTKSTYEEEVLDTRKRFYKILGITYSSWSLSVPITVILAFELSPWYRYKVVMMAEVIFRFLGHLLLSQLFCGPLSPISKENSLMNRDLLGLDDGMDDGFNHMPMRDDASL